MHCSRLVCFLGHFREQFDRSLLNCLTKTTLTKHKQCFTTFKSNIQTILETRASLSEITKWSEDFLRCIYNSIPTTCPTATKEVFIFRELLAVPDKQDRNASAALNITKIVKQKLPGQHVQHFAQSKRATSSIHGRGSVRIPDLLLAKINCLSCEWNTTSRTSRLAVLRSDFHIADQASSVVSISIHDERSTMTDSISHTQQR